MKIAFQIDPYESFKYTLITLSVKLSHMRKYKTQILHWLKVFFLREIFVLTFKNRKKFKQWTNKGYLEI